jgi:LacI family transcriptional regulator
MKKRVTIRDVAKDAGVSLGTASRALNRAGRVSEEAIAAVGRAARRLGYEPDSVAQSMRTRSTGVVGLLVSDFSNPLYARIIAAVETGLQGAGYALLLANTGNDAKREKTLIDLFRRRRVEGLILGPCAAESPQLLERLAAERAVVAIDRDFGPGGTGVHVDHYLGALQATRYLLNLGHTRIALMTPGKMLRPGRERIAGFSDAYRERGLQPEATLVRAERSSMEFAFSEALSLLSRPEPPTAFMCLGTRILAGALQGLRHSGRSIPDDVSVIGVGDTDLSRLFSPAITTLAWELDAVGTAAAQLLLKRLEHTHDAEPERIVITTDLILRDSCGPAPRDVAEVASAHARVLAQRIATRQVPGE